MASLEESEQNVHPAGITLDDGRRLAFRIYGDPVGYPLLALHGTPGSSSKFECLHRAACDQGIRIVAVDRWGYGGSDAHAAPTLAGFAADISTFADRLGLGRFAVIGVSGGGPYAAAIAAQLRGRITALALIAPVGQVDSATSYAMSAFHRLCFRTLPRLPVVMWSIFASLRALLQMSPRLVVGGMMLRAGPSDRTIMSKAAARDALAHCFIDGLRRTLDGPIIDMTLFASTWDCDPAAICAPAQLWIGDDDTNVPLLPALELARQIPGCITVRLPAEGHYWITQHPQKIAVWFATTLGLNTTAAAKTPNKL